MNVSGYLFYVILPILAFANFLIFVRFIKGPNLVDRIVALDLLLTSGIGVIAVYSIYANQATILDIAMILALIGFLGTVAYAYYMEKREKND